MELGQSVDCGLVSLLTGVRAAPGPMIREVYGRDLVGLRSHVPRPGLGLDPSVGFRQGRPGLEDRSLVGLEGREGIQAPHTDWFLASLLLKLRASPLTTNLRVMSSSRAGQMRLALMGSSSVAEKRGPLTTSLELVILPVFSLAETRRETTASALMSAAPQFSRSSETSVPSDLTTRRCHRLAGTGLTRLLALKKE